MEKLEKARIIYNNHQHNNNTEIFFVYIYEDWLIVNSASTYFEYSMFYRPNKSNSRRTCRERIIFKRRADSFATDYGIMMFDDKFLIGVNFNGGTDVVFELRKNDTSYSLHKEWKVPTSTDMMAMRDNGPDSIIYTVSRDPEVEGVRGIYVSDKSDFSKITQISKVKAMLAISDGKDGFFYSYDLEKDGSDDDCRVKHIQKPGGQPVCVASKGGWFFGFKGCAGSLAFVDYEI